MISKSIILSWQTCEDVTSTSECFQPSCANVSRPILTKKCREVLDEACEVIIEQSVEQQCTEVEQTEYEEQCSTDYEQLCEMVEQYQCLDGYNQLDSVLAADVVPPSSSYGVPQVVIGIQNIVPLASSYKSKAPLLTSSPIVVPPLSSYGIPLNLTTI